MSIGGTASVSNAEEFLKLYNEITDYLRVITRTDRSLPYSKLIDRAAEIDAPTKRVSNRLRDYGDLRNAIVHHREYPEEIIAEPINDAVIQFRNIVEEIRSPKKLIPTFERRVQMFPATDPLAKALSFMLEERFLANPCGPRWNPDTANRRRHCEVARGSSQARFRRNLRGYDRRCAKEGHALLFPSHELRPQCLRRPRSICNFVRARTTKTFRDPDHSERGL